MMSQGEMTVRHVRRFGGGAQSQQSTVVLLSVVLLD